MDEVIFLNTWIYIKKCLKVKDIGLRYILKLFYRKGKKNVRFSISCESSIKTFLK